MKHLSLLCFLFLFATASFAQNLNGQVKDDATKLGINVVQVIHKDKTVVTNLSGQFSIAGIKSGDRISFRVMGYETREIVVGSEHFKSPFVVYLKSAPIELYTVNIRAPRNYLKDSLMLRKEYASVFNYKGATLSDMFVNVNPEEKFPLALMRPANTSSLIKVNVLQIMNLLGKKKSQTSKLKSTLLADEAANYVNQRFSKNKVQTITALQGDSLNLFLQRFRPTADEMRRMNDYQLSIYIKDKFAEFVKP